MKNFTQAAVSYKGQEIQGLVLPVKVQRLDFNFINPEGYVCIGKQQFGNGLRICFIPKELKEETPASVELKEGEFAVSGYKTNLDIDSDVENLIKITKECFTKDPSENHRLWMIRTAKNNMGLNSFHELAEKTVNENWN